MLVKEKERNMQIKLIGGDIGAKINIFSEYRWL